MPVDDDKGGDFSFWQRIGQIKDSRDADAKLRRIAYGFRPDTVRWRKRAINGGIQMRQRIRDKKIGTDLLSQFLHAHV